MAKYLVTGIAGFIGSSIARALLERGDQVRGIDNYSTGRRENIAEILSAIEFVESDINDKAAIDYACAGIDYVFHEAAIASVPQSVADPVGNNCTNVNGTLSVLVAARDAGVKRVVYAASSSAYGDEPELPKQENQVPSPLSPYAAAKLAGEHYMAAFYHSYGLETVSLRYFNIFGPRQDPSSPYSGVLAKFITQLLAGQQPTIFGDGEQSRDFTYIDNVVSANLLAIKAPAENCAGRVFNIGTATAISLNETFNTLKRITGYAGPAAYGPARTGDVKHSLADITRAKQCIGYKPVTGFEDGLVQTVAWYRS